MEQREFHNALRILLNIDADELLACGALEEDWPSFRDDPYRFFIRTTDAVCDASER